ncbi:MAG: hypothetical protein HXY40_16335 [Chloroflexi bacterium]|nr:hypothetical protein [Chloroflexota bacterium]
MSDTTHNLADVFDSHAPSDKTAHFHDLLRLREQAWMLVNENLDLREDLACQDIRDIPALDGQIVGNIHTYTGRSSPVDWLIRSWIGRPVTGFTNIHLTCWLNSSVDVPHLGFALGTAPDVFFYCDLLPRYELMVQPQHLDQYYEPLNQLWVDLRRERSVTLFNPVNAYIRSTISPVALLGLVPYAVFKEKVEGAILHYVRYWVDLVKNAQPAPPETRAALAARDLTMRRTIVERDPANLLADRMVGVPLRERLVRILWGGERE